MPDHVLADRLRQPALRLHPLALSALVAASALGALTALSPSGAPRSPAAGVDPIALWLDTGSRNAMAEDTSGPAATAVVLTAGAEARQPPALDEAAARSADAVPAEAEAPSVALVPGQIQTAAAGPAETVPTAAAPKAAPAEPEPAHAVPSRWRDHTVKKGETLAQVLKAFGVDKDDRAKVIAAAKGTPALAKLKTGQKLRGRIDSDGGLLELQLKLDPKTSVHVDLRDDGYQIHTIDRPVEKRLAQTSAVIQSSLFVDGQDAGLSDAQILELAAIFGWDVDFVLGLRPGDRFSLIFEAEFLDGEKVDDGAILAAEFVNQGRRYRAVRFEDDDGTLGYYAPDGTSKKQAFLRSPLKLARVSSGFSLSRAHPILNTRRAHKGVDYSAPVGTPVKATGAGLVTFSGQKNGYGNVIELQHGEKYSTLYGHLSRFAEGLRVGEPVKQGQVIGYVGQTGLATGPHLHYEFRVAGEHRDPLSTKLPTALPLDAQDVAAFRKKSSPLLAQLDRMERTMVARAQ